MADFFRANPQPDVPARPATVPRTTGLPPNLPSPPAAAVLHDALGGPERHHRRRGRRTRAGDIDAGGRRGAFVHPDDPDEFLPEYDDKDVLPRYQDVQSERAGSGSMGRMSALRGLVGRSSGGGSGGSGREEVMDTIPLVTRLPAAANSSTTLDVVVSSAGSHEGHERPTELNAGFVRPTW